MKKVFPNCPLSADMRAGAKNCVWEQVRVLGSNTSLRSVEYKCRFCNDVKVKVEQIQAQ